MCKGLLGAEVLGIETFVKIIKRKEKPGSRNIPFDIGFKILQIKLPGKLGMVYHRRGVGEKKLSA